MANLLVAVVRETALKDVATTEAMMAEALSRPRATAKNARKGLEAFAESYNEVKVSHTEKIVKSAKNA